MATEIRLNKYIASTGLCSRRQADTFIAKGLISVNGHIVCDLGIKIKDTDKVLYKNQILKTNDPVYILLNKPKDYICTIKDEKDRKIVTQLINIKNSIHSIADIKSKRFSKGHFLFLNEIAKKGSKTPAGIFPVGRLDRNTTGILILTNDGHFTQKLAHPSQEITKEYEATLDKPLEHEDFEKIKQGIVLEDGKIQVDNIICLEDTPQKVIIRLHSGKNRIIRRMFESLEYKVIKLDRILFGSLTKKNLPRGKWRFLTPQEIDHIQSPKTAFKKD